MRALICYSVTQEEADRFDEAGPRRDIRLLIDRCQADVLHRRGMVRRKGILGKLTGPQVLHAWQAAGKARSYDVVFADGEHVGLPMLFFMVLRRGRHTRVVMLCHLIDKRWKRWLLRVGTRLVPTGSLLLHSVRQAEVASRVASGWKVSVVPYQVDTNFWQAAGPPSSQVTPLF